MSQKSNTEHLSCVLCLVSRLIYLRVGRTEFLSEDSGEEFTSKLIQIVDRIQFLMCRTKVPIFLLSVSCQLPLVPKGLSLVLPHDPLHLRTSNRASNPSHGDLSGFLSASSIPRLRQPSASNDLVISLGHPDKQKQSLHLQGH